MVFVKVLRELGSSKKDRFQIPECSHIMPDRILFTLSMFLGPNIVQDHHGPPTLPGNEVAAALGLGLLEPGSDFLGAMTSVGS